MKQTIVRGTGVFITTLVCSCVVFLLPVSANVDDHDESGEMTTAETSTVDIKRMEQLINVLKQLIAVMTELRVQHPGASFIIPAMTTPEMQDHHTEMSEHHSEMSEHHTESTTAKQDESDDEEVTPAVAKLIIEIEEHFGKTHAHVRFIDGRPEAMFFVDVPVSNEDGIISGISAQTGLGTDEVRNALKYIGM